MITEMHLWIFSDGWNTMNLRRAKGSVDSVSGQAIKEGKVSFLKPPLQFFEENEVGAIHEIRLFVVCIFKKFIEYGCDVLYTCLYPAQV